MLNPEFCLLDPDLEQIERLASLAGEPGEVQPSWKELFQAAEPAVREDAARRLTAKLAVPGIHPLQEIYAAIAGVTEELDLVVPEPFTYGWPDSLLAPLLASFPAPCVMLFGVLDGEGIWAGALAGISRGGLDFLATFQTLWSDEPELAAKQSLDGLGDICSSAGRRFGRPARGLFLYRDEFMAWRAGRWSREMLEKFIQQGTAKISPDNGLF